MLIRVRHHVSYQHNPSHYTHKSAALTHLCQHKTVLILLQSSCSQNCVINLLRKREYQSSCVKWQKHPIIFKNWRNAPVVLLSHYNATIILWPLFFKLLRVDCPSGVLVNHSVCPTIIVINLAELFVLATRQKKKGGGWKVVRWWEDVKIRNKCSEGVHKSKSEINVQNDRRCS